MPRAGQVKVQLTRRMAADTAAWLCDVYTPPTPTVLGGGSAEHRRAELESGRRVGRLLGKRARWRRAREEFACALDRDDAQWLGHLWEATLWFGGAGLSADNDAGFIVVPFNVRRALKRFHDRARVRRGPARRSRRDLEERASPTFNMIGERQRKRTKRQLKYDLAVEAWIKRGNSLLGGPEPFPEK